MFLEQAAMHDCRTLINDRPADTGTPSRSENEGPRLSGQNIFESAVFKASLSHCMPSWSHWKRDDSLPDH